MLSVRLNSLLQRWLTPSSKASRENNLMNAEEADNAVEETVEEVLAEEAEEATEE